MTEIKSSMMTYFKLANSVTSHFAQWNRASKKDPVQICLETFRNPPAYACNIQFKDMPLLKDANRGGRVSAPNIEDLLAVATEAPFGKNGETVVDPSVRRAHQISVELLNETFLKAMADSIEHAYDKIAPLGKSVKVKPYRLHIYQEGGHFKEHRDTPHGKRHIMSVIVELGATTSYTGGEIEVKVADKTWTSASHLHEEGKLPCYGWYIDYVHRVNPVLSGTRVVLQCDLFVKKGEERYIWPFYNDDNHYGPELNHDLTDTVNLEHSHLVAEEVTKILLKKEIKDQSSVFVLSRCYPVATVPRDILTGCDLTLLEALEKHFQCRLINLACDVSYTSCEEKIRLGPTTVDYDGSTEALKMSKATIYDAGNHDLYRTVITHQEGAEYTGNEAMPEEYVFHMVGLWATPKDDQNLKKRSRDEDDEDDKERTAKKQCSHEIQ